MELRLRSAGSATENSGNFTMLVAVEVVEQQSGAEPTGQPVHGIAEHKAVGDALQSRVNSPEFETRVTMI